MLKKEFIEWMLERGISATEESCTEKLASVIQQAVAEEKEKTRKWLHKSDGLKFTLKPGCRLDFEHWEYNDMFLDEFPEYKYCPFCGRKIERV